MSFHYFRFDGVCCITFLRGNVFYLHDQNTKKSYRESVTKDKMEQSVRKLNKRINFAIEAVREALFESQPVDAKLFSEQENGEPIETEAVLRLKYRVKDAPASLKWEWHMSRTDDGNFYCALMLLQLGHTVSLGNLQENLVAIIEQKDREIQQYRNEGAVLRRTTVATKPFDGSAYFKQYKSLLDIWQSYGQFAGEHFSDSIVEFPKFPMEPNGTIVKVEDGPMDNGALTTLSPRNRKRKALEADQQHVERMALQRRRISKLEYKNSESQEDELEPDYDFAAPQTMLDYNGQDNNLEASSTISNGRGSTDESSATTESESGENARNGQDDNKEASSTDSNGRGSTDEFFETSTESECGENGRDISLSNIRLHVTGDSEDKADEDDNESKNEFEDKKDEPVNSGTKKAEGFSSSSSEDKDVKEKNKEKDEDSDSKAKGDGKPEDKSNTSSSSTSGTDESKVDDKEGAQQAEETTMSTSATDADNKKNAE